MKISRLPKIILPFLGTIMILSWIVVIGPLGGLLIGATAYFMSIENTFAGSFCVAVLLLPFVLTIIWGCGTWAEAILNKRSDTAKYVLRNESTKPLSIAQGVE